MSHTEQLRNLMNLMESIESKGPSEEEITAARKKVAQIISQEDGGDEEQLDEVNWKKALGGAALAGALATGAGAGIGDAKAQSVGDFLNLAGQVAKVAQAAAGDNNHQVQAPRAQAQPQAQQAQRPQSQPQVDPQAQERAEKQRQAKKAAAQNIKVSDLIDTRTNYTFIASCAGVSGWAQMAPWSTDLPANQKQDLSQQIKRFHEFAQEMFKGVPGREKVGDGPSKIHANQVYLDAQGKANQAHDGGNAKVLLQAYDACRRGFGR